MPTTGCEVKITVLESLSIPQALSLAWMQSFSSLMKDAVQGNSADSSSIVETLRTQLLTESVDPSSVSEISNLFKSLLEELTFQPEGHALLNLNYKSLTRLHCRTSRANRCVGKNGTSYGRSTNSAKKSDINKSKPL